MISGRTRHLRTRAWLWAFSLVVATLLGRRAGAQLTPVQKLEMKQHYEKATRAYDVQKYSEAVDEYQRAYEIGGDPAMLYNVAQSYRLNDQLAEAQRFYRRYLQRSPNARNREDVERKISDLDKILEDRRKKMAAAPPPPAVAPVVFPVVPPPEPPPAPRLEPTPGRRIGGIVVASFGVAALATAGVFAKLGADKSDKAEHELVYDPNVDSNGKDYNKVAWASLIVGGVALVTGGILIITSRGRSFEDRADNQPAGDEPGERQAPRPRRPDGDGRQAMILPLVGGRLLGAAATLQF